MAGVHGEAVGLSFVASVGENVTTTAGQSASDEGLALALGNVRDIVKFFSVGAGHFLIAAEAMCLATYRSHDGSAVLLEGGIAV